MPCPPQTELPPEALAAPDGSVRLGVGPGSWVLHGWGPGTRGWPDLLTGLVGRDVHGGAGAVGPGGNAGLDDTGLGGSGADLEVVGTGRLASLLRARLPTAAPATGPGRWGLQVLVGQRVVPAAELLAQRRAWVLPVVVQPQRVVVGPLVRPDAGPCLVCLDRWRSELDPSWPEICRVWGGPLAQLDEVRVEPAALDAAAAVTELVVRSTLAASPVEVGLALEVGSTPPHLVMRSWTRHAGCPRHRPHLADGGGG